jgi:hypothetical protein
LYSAYTPMSVCPCPRLCGFVGLAMALPSPSLGGRQSSFLDEVLLWHHSTQNRKGMGRPLHRAFPLY